MARACASAMPDVQAEPFRRVIDGDEQLGIAAFAGDDERHGVVSKLTRP